MDRRKQALLPSGGVCRQPYVSQARGQSFRGKRLLRRYSFGKGRNVAVEKVQGRRASIKRASERFAESYVKSDLPIVVAHADCDEDAELFKSEIVAKLAELGDSDTQVLTEVIGPIVGASVGPGTMGVYFFGKEVTDGKDD